MKKWFSLILALSTLLLLCSLVGCKNDPVDPELPEEPDAQTVTLIDNGVSEYRIIISDHASDTVKSQVRVLSKAIETATGVKLSIKTDWEDQDSNAHIKEILVGSTNRTESIATVDKLSTKQYAIEVSGNKIVLIGATDEMLPAAITSFLNVYFDYYSDENYTPKSTITLPFDLSTIGSFDVYRNIALYVTNEDLSYVDALYSALKKEVDTLDLKSLEDDPGTVFNAKKYGTVIIAGVEKMTNASKSAIEKYMNNGGRILTLGGPAFESTLYSLDGEWYERDEYLATVIGQLDDDHKQVIIDASSPSVINQFERATNAPGSGYQLKVGDYGLPGSSAQLFHEVENLSNWDNIICRFADPVAVVNDGLTALTFHAKAMDDHTGSLYIEITDANNSRWIASVPLIQSWEQHVLLPTDFTWWHDSEATQSDVPNFNGMRKLVIGFARSGQAIAKGHHSYCISDIVLISTPDIESENYLAIDSLTPMYELYPITNGAKLVTSSNQVYINDRDYALSREIISCSPGRQGLGFNNGRTSRFVPLIEVKDKDGLHSGYAAWMHIFSCAQSNINGKMDGSILACFSSVSEEFYNADGIAAIVETVKVMTRSAFIIEGGTDEFIYVDEDTDDITAGVSFLLSKDADVDGLVASVALYQGDSLIAEYSSDTIAAKRAQNYIKQISGDYDLSSGKPDRAVATLTLDGAVIDQIEHDIKFWTPTPDKDRHFVYIENGQFKKNGKPITFFGVNYMPSYGIAEPNWRLFEYYVSAAAYDPTVVANDLDRIAALGMNSVSIFVYHDDLMDSNNILDMIDMCAERGLYVNLGIRPSAYPLLDYNEEQVEQLLHHLHFHENEIIYAYDIAWEPRIGEYEDDRYIGRKGWDEDWAKWIKVQYGSLSHAEELWGIKLTKTAEGHPYVSDAMMNDQTGKYTKVMSAYYRFIDDQVAKLMNDKMLHMQPLAPNQMFTFRMNMSGNGLRTASFMPSTFCFDFQSLASSMAYMEPEGYQLDATDEAALQIAIANAYARYTQPNSPVIWKEIGLQVWDNTDDCNFDPDENGLASASAYYEYSLEYLLNSYTSGVYAWWYAGGYRISETSDFGIFNPDGSDRPITTLLREYAPKFINQGGRPEADVLIEVERDNQNGGIFGIYEAVADQARQAYDNGQFFDFVDANMDSANDVVYADEVYPAAVGGTAENGLYPLRYVNGMIKDFKVVTEGGKTYAEVTVCNTKQSTWRANTVSIVSTSASNVSIDYTIGEDVDYLENLTVRFQINGKGSVALRFEIEGVQFGPLFTSTIK